MQEGEVGAADDIVKITDGPERTSVAEVDAVLYLPGHSREQLERLWGIQDSQMRNKHQHGPAFDRCELRILIKESDSVTSFILSPIDRQALPLFQAGQFVVLRLQLNPDKPPVLRSYSLSDLPAADHFRISVKNELNGVGSAFLCRRTREGDILDVSAPRGSFTLLPTQSPVVLLSAGVGATPVMSMLHTLVAQRSQREIWWIYGARNRVDHPFAEEPRSLLKQFSRGRGYIVYSRPAAIDRLGTDFDASGTLTELARKNRRITG